MTIETKQSGARLALVTGGAGGIGWAICQRLALDGFRVALADLDEAVATERAAALGPEHVALAADLTDPGAAALLPRRAAQALGGLDVIVNNAGVTDSSGRSLVDLPQASFDRLVALNLTAVERICEAAVHLLPEGGRIVNLASGASFRPLALRGPYSATKAGVVALTEMLAASCASRGIAVSAVAPGYTRTPLVETLEREGRVDLVAVARAIPLGRLATPEDIAATVAFCAGPHGAVLAGQTIVVDGGGLFGAAPQGAAPERGQAEGGAIAVLGPLDMVEGAVAVAGADRLGEQAALRAVIDARALAGGASPVERLAEARDIALACAAHRGRAENFSLIFVTGEADSPVTRAAQAMFARTLALEWAPAGLRVNSVVWNGRSTNELDALCRFLASPEAGLVTGQAILAGGLN